MCGRQWCTCLCGGGRCSRPVGVRLFHRCQLNYWNYENHKLKRFHFNGCKCIPLFLQSEGHLYLSDLPEDAGSSGLAVARAVLHSNRGPPLQDFGAQLGHRVEPDLLLRRVFKVLKQKRRCGVTTLRTKTKTLFRKPGENGMKENTTAGASEPFVLISSLWCIKTHLNEHRAAVWTLFLLGLQGVWLCPGIKARLSDGCTDRISKDLARWAQLKRGNRQWKPPPLIIYLHYPTHFHPRSHSNIDLQSFPVLFENIKHLCSESSRDGAEEVWRHEVPGCLLGRGSRRQKAGLLWHCARERCNQGIQSWSLSSASV